MLLLPLDDEREERLLVRRLLLPVEPLFARSVVPDCESLDIVEPLPDPVFSVPLLFWYVPDVVPLVEAPAPELLYVPEPVVPVVPDPVVPLVLPEL